MQKNWCARARLHASHLRAQFVSRCQKRSLVLASLKKKNRLKCPWQDSNLQSLGYKPSALSITPHRPT